MAVEREIEKLYLTYKDDLFRYLLWLTRDSALAEDLLQDTFVKALSSLFRFQEKSSIKTWLFSIARHVWLSHLRKERCKDRQLTSLSAAPPEEILLSKEMMEKIELLLASREERAAKIFKLRCQGYSFAEISQHIGISEGSARVIDFRTRTFLRQALENEGLNP